MNTVNQIEEKDEDKPPPSDVDIMMNELEENKNERKRIHREIWLKQRGMA